jgi:hydrogenase/urease accessory protein HupE
MWLNIVSLIFIIIGAWIILVDQSTVSDVRFSGFSETLYGILLIAGSICLRYRWPVGWWWILINAIVISVLCLLIIFSYDDLPTVEGVVLGFVSFLFMSLAVVLAINHPWRWKKG